jgi:hypothetical protein
MPLAIPMVDVGVAKSKRRCFHQRAAVPQGEAVVLLAVVAVLQQAGDYATIGDQCFYKEVAATLHAMGRGAGGHG